LVYRRTGDTVEVLIAHPGGPFWRGKDEGAWSIPKGEFDQGEDPESAARRELAEEVGIVVEGELVDLGSVTQRSGKVVHAWAYEADFDPAALSSNTFTIEWPPRSGRRAEFPEIDEVAWCSPGVAADKLNPAQVILVHRLLERLQTP
jgi:predicted NUDIX family NTP pyrophosphohydrolase